MRSRQQADIVLSRISDHSYLFLFLFEISRLLQSVILGWERGMHCNMYHPQRLHSNAPSPLGLQQPRRLLFSAQKSHHLFDIVRHPLDYEIPHPRLPFSLAHNYVAAAG